LPLGRGCVGISAIEQTKKWVTAIAQRHHLYAPLVRFIDRCERTMLRESPSARRRKRMRACRLKIQLKASRK
jgi:hypothetical protein